MRHVRRVQPPAYAEAARLCLEKMALACDALAASSADPRWFEVAILVECAGIVLRELERGTAAAASAAPRAWGGPVANAIAAAAANRQLVGGGELDLGGAA